MFSLISLAIFFLEILSKFQIYSIPTCIIIDTAKNQDEEATVQNRSSSSLLLRNLRMLDQPRVPEFVVQSIPLSFIDLKQTAPPLPLIDIDQSPMKKSLLETNIERTYLPCSMKFLDEIEQQIVVPFEFRRLRIEQPDHQSKFLDDDQRETVPDGSTAVYERRSNPDGLRFCRTCHDGLWTQLTVCEVVRCDAELLRANPRLVTEWGEIKAIEGGALYAPSSIYAIYAFSFGPHCKQCEPNGEWSKYALPELCSGIKFFGYSTTTADFVDQTKLTTTTTATISTPEILPKRMFNE